MKKIIYITIIVFANNLIAQTGLVNTAVSPLIQMQPVGLSDVKLTNGFWYDRMNVCTKTMVPSLWDIYTSDTICYAFKNFKVAAGIDTGRFRGPSFHDGDFYKTVEAMAANYAYTKEESINKKMDDAIAVIAKAQKEDGYIYTKAIIEQRKTGATKMFDDKLSFEAYNFGHLMTAACVHFRATGKNTLLDIAKKASNFLIQFYNNATPEQARNAICPSHYMGLVEMYRTTGDIAYLNLVKKLIDIRGNSQGSDDNSDRIPFRQMTKVNGHAVRANYLFAGVADVYAESGDKSLLNVLDVMWNDVTNKKMYVTGGCGALYDGLSLEGLTYKPDSLQQIQQAYGKDFQLPNKTAHNETCANIGNLLWNWRMFLITADRKYMDIVELELYNAILSGVNLDGDKYFYTNPLEVSKNYPYNLRWSGERQKYISKSNCCPPNVVRTIAEVNNYFYSVFETGLYINLYGSNTLHAWLPSGPEVKLKQTSDYPNNGFSIIEFQQNIDKEIKLYLRVPEWASSFKLYINGQLKKYDGLVNGYAKIERKWKKGDQVKIEFPMETVLLEANPLVEENKNQVALKRGPIVYCMERADATNLYQLNSLGLKANTVFKPIKTMIGGHSILQLEANVFYTQIDDWSNKLYRKVQTNLKPIKVKFTPYYAWGNRGVNDMSVWLNLIRN